MKTIMSKNVTTRKKIKEVTIEISNWCPLNCVHCSTQYSYYYDGFEEYIIRPNDTVNMAIEHINSTPDTPIRVRFSGGEPLPFLDKEIFRKLKQSCPNIVEWIITTSGSIPTLAVRSLMSRLKEEIDDLGIDNMTFRISLYGDKDQHTDITRNFVCYDNSIKNIEWLIHHDIPVEITTPIFGFWNVLNVIMTARKYDVPVRLARLISTPAVKVPSQRKQLLIAKIMKILYKNVQLTCSLYGRCGDGICDYPKSTVLATGKVIGCAIGKLQKKNSRCLHV